MKDCLCARLKPYFLSMNRIKFSANLNKKILQESSVKYMNHSVARKTTEDPGEGTLKAKCGIVITDVPAD